jgi:hypothetical protein
MSSRGVLAGLLVVCGACCEESDFVPVTVPVYSGAAMGDVRYMTPAVRSTDPCDQPPAEIANCTPLATVRASGIATQPSCYLDTTFRAGDVGRVMSCPGSKALVVFEKAVFSGDLVNGYLHVCKTTSYDFPQGDACTWRTEQRVSGPTSGTPLSFSYTESPVAGHDCTLACTAKASLDLLSF